MLISLFLSMIFSASLLMDVVILVFQTIIKCSFSIRYYIPWIETLHMKKTFISIIMKYLLFTLLTTITTLIISFLLVSYLYLYLYYKSSKGFYFVCCLRYQILLVRIGYSFQARIRNISKWF